MINPDALADELNDLLATEERSLVRHVQNEATPYLTPRTIRVWRDLQAMGATSIDHARRLARLLNDLELRVRPIPFPIGVANYHFLDVPYLLTPIIEEKSQQIAAYERALDHADSEPHVTAELTALLEANRRQLESLEKHASDLGAATAA